MRSTGGIDKFGRAAGLQVCSRFSAATDGGADGHRIDVGQTANHGRCGAADAGIEDKTFEVWQPWEIAPQPHAQKDRTGESGECDCESLLKALPAHVQFWN